MSQDRGLLRVVFCAVGQDPVERLVPHTLKSYQEMVGGFIEPAPLVQGSRFAAMVNEDGRRLSLEPNLTLPGWGYPLLGPFFITYLGANFESLTKTEVAWFIKYLMAARRREPQEMGTLRLLLGRRF